MITQDPLSLVDPLARLLEHVDVRRVHVRAVEREAVGEALAVVRQQLVEEVEPAEGRLAALPARELAEARHALQVIGHPVCRLRAASGVPRGRVTVYIPKGYINTHTRKT